MFYCAHQTHLPSAWILGICCFLDSVVCFHQSKVIICRLEMVVILYRVSGSNDLSSEWPDWRWPQLSWSQIPLCPGVTGSKINLHFIFGNNAKVFMQPPHYPVHENESHLHLDEWNLTVGSFFSNLLFKTFFVSCMCKSLGAVGFVMFLKMQPVIYCKILLQFKITVFYFFILTYFRMQFILVLLFFVETVMHFFRILWWI